MLPAAALQPSSSYFHMSWQNCLFWRHSDTFFLSLLALHQCRQTWKSSSLKISWCLINFAHPLFVSFSGEAADAIDFFPPLSFSQAGAGQHKGATATDGNFQKGSPALRGHGDAVSGCISSAERHAQLQGHNWCRIINLVAKWTDINFTLLTQKHSLFV